MTTIRTHPGWLLIGLLGVMLIGNIDIAITNIAMPAIHRDLHASGSEMELVVSGYTLAYAIMLIPSARLGEMKGHRTMILLGLGIFTVSSLVSALSPNALVLFSPALSRGLVPLP